MPDSTLSQAVREAYASATNRLIYHTLEFRHPAFTTPIRVVRDYNDLTARLESNAPVDAGASVIFQAFSFEVTKPEVSPTGIPQMVIQIDNVSRAIVANIEAAMATSEMVKCTYREYVEGDLSQPANNPTLTFTILTINADMFKVRATAGYPALNNIRFPRTEYDTQTFPGLVQ